MAFVVTGPLATGRPHVGSLRTRLARGTRVSTRRARWAATFASEGTDSKEKAVEAESTGVEYAAPGVELDTEMLKEKAAQVVSDVSSRPGFYGKIVAYGLGTIVGVTILQAVVGAIDAIPILPSLLELIGLGYTSWFVWRYVLFKESREELLDEIEDLVGRARPSSTE